MPSSTQAAPAPDVAAAATVVAAAVASTPATTTITSKITPPENSSSETAAAIAAAAASASAMALPQRATTGAVSSRGRYVSPGMRNSTSTSTSTTTQQQQQQRSLPKAVTDTSDDNNSGKPPPPFAAAAAATAAALAVKQQQTDENETPKSPKVTATDARRSPANFFLLSSPTAMTPTKTTSSMDFFKNGAPDTACSNVLAWLQSPTANSLFSPTPTTGGATPANQHTMMPTPTISTSFFFSDVASLNNNGTTATNVNVGGGSNSSSSIICISPLVKRHQQNGHGHSGATPIDLKDIFASPEERKFLNLKTERGVDAVLAEKDVMEDEDLSVLLQLASPRGSGGGPHNNGTNKRGSSNLQTLQLPMMDNNGNGSSSNKYGSSTKNPHHKKLAQKKLKTEDFLPPTLEMRKSSSSSSAVAASGGERGGSGKTATKRPSHVGSSSAAASELYPRPPVGSMRVTVGKQQQAAQQSQKQQPLAPHQPQDPYMYPPPPWGYPYHYPPMYQPPPPPPPHPSTTAATPAPQQKASSSKTNTTTSVSGSGKKPPKKKSSPSKKKSSPPVADRQKSAKTIQKLSNGKNDKAASLAAAILRGVTMRPSGKWQAQLYFCGKSRYIGVFDSREKAALAYEIAREKLKAGCANAKSDPKEVEILVNCARKAAFDGVNEQLK